MVYRSREPVTRLLSGPGERSEEKWDQHGGCGGSGKCTGLGYISGQTTWAGDEFSIKGEGERMVMLYLTAFSRGIKSDSKHIPQKVKQRFTIQSSNSAPRYISKKTGRKDSNTCVPIFTEVLFTIEKICKQAKCLSKDKWINKMYYIHKTEYHSVIKGMKYWYRLQYRRTLKTPC